MENRIEEKGKRGEGISVLERKIKNSMSHRDGARNLCLGGPICVANLLVYTNFYTHTQTHVSIHTQKINIFYNEALKLNVSFSI